ncbi:hypothetical protein [Streptomyces microflavus]
MPDAEADWILESVLVGASVNQAALAGGPCHCEGIARSCYPCRSGKHDACHKDGADSYREGDLFGPKFRWPPLADVWLAGRTCGRSCGCPTCYPPSEQLDLFGGG